jgi:sugar phosphate isomerase/epimerase
MARLACAGLRDGRFLSIPWHMSDKPFSHRALSRREFISRTLAASSAVTLCGSRVMPGFAAQSVVPPIVVFTKVYQELNLNFDDAAAVTAEAELDGVDCPVRPAGEILPERAQEDMPKYVAALGKRGLKMPLLTTAITSPSSPHTEDILRTAKKVGVQFYRTGFVMREKDISAEQQCREVRAQLKELAALNQQIGIGGLVQNHSPAGRAYLGGDLTELYALVQGFDPSQMGVAFDIGHALVVHRDEWRAHFDKLKPYIKVVYIKDVTRDRQWVPFGQGEIGHVGYFKLLKEMGYRAPISLHVEFDWTDKGKTKTREALVKALRESGRVLKQWLA